LTSRYKGRVNCNGINQKPKGDYFY
jgi:hypothetical protein